MADMVISDLARWEDWTVVEKLATIFREATTDETSWVRTPIITYMEACPLDDAKTYLKEFRELDPDAATRADMMADIAWDDDEEEEAEDDSRKHGAKKGRCKDDGIAFERKKNRQS